MRLLQVVLGCVLLMCFAVGMCAGPTAFFSSLPVGEWTDIPNSALSLSPLFGPYRGCANGVEGPSSIYNSWGSGALDTNADRLLIRGGGHAAYAGNEIYAFNFRTLQWERPFDGSPPETIPCPPPSDKDYETYPPSSTVDVSGAGVGSDPNRVWFVGDKQADGTLHPAARHAYGGFFYDPDLNTANQIGGAHYNNGGRSNSVWSYDLSTKRWLRLPDIPEGDYGDVGAFDPVTHRIYHVGKFTFNVFDDVTNTWTTLNNHPAVGEWGSDDRKVGVVIPDKRWLVVLGRGEIWIFHLDTGQMWVQPTTGPAPIFPASIAHVPGTDTVHIWTAATPKTLFELDLSTWAFYAINPSTGTTPAVTGFYRTLNRFGYDPEQGVFYVTDSFNAPISVFKPSFAPALEGNVDRLDCTSIEGWAWDQRKANTRLSVDVFSDGTLIASVSANIFSQALFNAGKGDGSHQFRFDMPRSVQDGAPHALQAKYSGTSTVIPGLGGSLTCSAPTIPSAPTGLAASSQSSSQINLSWADTSGNETGFRIERRSASDTGFSPIAIVGQNTHAFQDQGLPASTQFFYRVIAVDNAGDSAPSNEANATTGIPRSFVNGGFETPDLGGSFRYNPDGATWTFAGGGGISGNFTGFTDGNAPAPEGRQVAFLQESGSISQTANIPAGQYVLSFFAAQRLNYAIGAQSISVQLDGTEIARFAPSGQYSSFTTAPFTLASGGNHTIALVGLATADYTAFVDDVHFVAITAASVTSSANPAIVGALVTFTALVKGSSPTGAVSFSDGGALVTGCSNVALTGTGDSKTASCTTTAGSIGTHDITAAYGGDANNAPSSSPVLAQIINPTTAGFSNGGFETPNAGGGYVYTPIGSSWVFAAGAGISANNTAFTSGNGSAPEGGQVAFFQASTSITQTANFSAGRYVLSFSAAQRLNYQFGTQVIAVQVDGSTVAQFQPPAGPYSRFSTPAFTIATSGNHTVSLVGVGSGSDFTGFVDDVRLAAESTTALTSSNNPAVVGSLVSLTATINGVAPTGTVAFLDGGTPVSGCVAVALNSSGSSPTASCSTIGLTIGTHNIVATYGGDSVNAASTSPTLAQVITPVPVNVAPTVSLTAPVDGATYVAPATITLSATANDGDGTVSKVEFLQGSTVVGTVTSAPYTFTWTAVPVGTYTLTARATDNSNAVTTSSAVTINVVPANVPPTVSLTAPLDGASYVAPASITLAATAGDSDGTVSKVEFLRGSTVIATVASAPFNYTWSGVAVGTYTLTARATDNGNAVTTSTPITVSVNSVNSAPTVTLTAPVNGATYVTPASITLSANAADSDGTVSKVEFFQGATVIGMSTSAPYTFNWTNVLAGTYSLTARATDNSNATTTSTAVTVTVTSPVNVAPTVSLTAPVNGASYVAPASITLSANAADSDGTVSKVEFFQGATLIGTATSAPYTFNWTNVPAGTYSLTARATDNSNAITNSTAITVTVTSPVNVAPTVTLTAPVNGATYVAPASITLSANAADSDGTVSKVEFLQGSTVIGTLTSAPYSFAWTNVPAGTYSLTARATDNSNAITNSTAITVTVTSPVNVAPTVSLTAPVNGASYVAPASISLSANAADSDGTISKVEFLQGSTVLATVTSAPYTFNWTNVVAGSYTLTARATDDSSAVTTSDPVTVTVSASTSSGVDIASQDNGGVATASSEDGSGSFPASAANDGNRNGGGWQDGTAGQWPDTVQVNFSAQQRINRIDVFTLQDGTPVEPTPTLTFTQNGITAFEVQSWDGLSWATVPGGSVTGNDKVWRSFSFAPLSTDRIRIVVLAAQGSSSRIAEVEAWTAPANVAPTVSLTAPADGSSYVAPASISLSANASDSDGTISKVDFLQGSTVIGTVNSAPYTFNWTNVAAGNYSLSARATDNGNATTTSTAVNVTVTSPVNVAPTVTLTAPVNGASYVAPASITLSANAADSDGTVSKVEFFQGATLIGTATSAPYTFNWTNVPAGTYSLNARATDNSNATTTSTAVNVTVTSPVNVAPTVSLTAPVNGASYVAPASITLSANAADSDGTVSKVEFLQGSTVIGTVNSAPYTFNWTNVPAGTYSLTARATDNSNATTTSTAVNVTVTSPVNVAPTVSLTAPVNGASYVAPASITLSANAADSDGTVSKVEFLQGSTVIGTATSAPYTFNWTNVAAGNYNLSARATDNSNATTTSTAVNVTVTSPVNVAPTVSLTAPVNGATYVAPASITLSANAADSDGTISKVEFLQGSTVIGTLTSAPYSFAWTNVPAGTYSLTARATDNSNAITNSTAITVTVTSPVNVAPTVSLTAPVNGASYVAPASITVSANAADSDGTVSKVDFLQGSTVIGTVNSAPYTFNWTNVAAGNYSLSARATDNSNATTTSTAVNVTVTSPVNVAPTVTLTAPVNGASYVAPASITLSANAADSDGTVSKVEFFQGATLIGTATSAPYTFNWTNVPAGTYSLTARATDNSNAITNSTAITVTVTSAVNVAPTVSLTAPADGSSYVAPASITLSANAADSDGTISKVEFLQGSTVIGTLTSAPYSFAWTNVPAGTYSLTARATDNSSATTTSTAVNVTVTSPVNVAPTVTLTAPVNGATYVAPASITLSANAADSDGTVSKVEFLQGSTVIGTATTAPYTFNWTNVLAGTYSLTARATDNSNAITNSTAITVTVTSAVNVAPTVSLTAPADGSSYVAPASITLSANAADSDGTISKVEFLQGSTVIGTATSAPYTFAWTNVAAGNYSLSARATDNSSATTTSTAVNVTVTSPVNVAPTVTLTAPVNGATYVAPVSITLSASAADTDGTVSKVEFLQGSTVLATVTSAPYTFNWTNVVAGSYTLTARATDNSNASTTSAPVNVTVTATAPSFANGGFETPNLGGTFRYGPTGATWVFGGGAGMSANNTGFTSGNSGAPEGAQVGFLQLGSSMTQTVNLAAGQYTLSLTAAQRKNSQSGTQVVAIQVDGVTVDQYQPPGTAYSSFVSAPFTINSTGNHTIGMVGAGSGSDYTAFVDDVRLNTWNGPVTTTTTVASSSNPAFAGSVVTLTATVSGTAVTGTVAFTDGGATIAGCAAVALTGSGNSKSSTCSTSALSTGTHSIQATYSGDSGNLASNSSAFSQVVSATAPSFSNGGFETPNLGGTFRYGPAGATWVFANGSGISANNTAFTSGNGGAPEGTQVGFLQVSGSMAQTVNLAAGQYTLSVTAAQRRNSQSGTQVIAIQVDGVTVDQYQPPASGYASFTTAPFTVSASGNHTISLIGVGSGSDYTAFVDDVRLAAWTGPAGTSTTLASSNNPSFVGSPVTFTATVAGTSVTGTVGFADGGASISGCGAVTLSGSGSSRTATCSTSSLATGTRSIVASYSGDAFNLASTSNTLLQVVNATAPSFANGGFETPNLGGTFRYGPTGAIWVFGGGAGMSANNTGFTSGNSGAPEGAQVGFLQLSSSMTQTVNLAAGQYTLSLTAAQRKNSQSGAQVIAIQVDGVTVGQYQPPGNAYSSFTTPLFIIGSSGNHTVGLVGVGSGSDYTAFVDDVRITIQ